MTSELRISGPSWFVVKGLKLLTLRLDHPKYSVFTPGDRVALRYDTGSFDIGTIFGVQHKPLEQFTESELLLDGFVNISGAISSLKKISGYERIQAKTPMVGIAFTTSSHLETYLDESKRANLFSTPLNRAIREKDYHGLFLPSYLMWLAWRKEQVKKTVTLKDWHDLLVRLKIFTRDDLISVVEKDAGTAKFYKLLSADDIKETVHYAATNSPQYRSLVLCEPCSVTS